MMQNYFDLFTEASNRTDAIAGRMSNYPLQITPELFLDIPMIVAGIERDFSDFLPNTDMLPGKCFVVARELSYVLCELGIRHTVTVGDIELVDGLYAGVTLEKLLQDVSDGYQLDFVDGIPTGKLIDAHAWITLENGMVIDATILPSQHRKNVGATEMLSFADAVYYTGKPNTPVIRHIPMLTGFVYHQRVLTAVMDGDFQNYFQWYEDYAQLMARIDLYRLVPELIQA